MKHTFILIEKKSYLFVKNSQLIIKHNEDEVVVPIEDITVILLSHFEVVLTKDVVVYAVDNNVSIQFTDNKFMPSSCLLPYHGNSLQTKIINKQSKITGTFKNKIWKTIIQAKTTNQNAILEKEGIVSNRFKSYIKMIDPGDKTNIESQAARMYFPLIFGTEFRRDQDGGDVINIYLNYSYAILRGMIARSITATGLHPALGIWHCNKYDPMPLANDLMEPLRPIIDGYIKNYIRNKNKEKLTFLKQDREHLIKLINEGCMIMDKATTLDIAIPIYISSIKQIICEEGKPFLKLPKVMK